MTLYQLFYQEFTFVNQGPVVQSIVSLTSSLRGELVKCYTTLKPNTLIFLLKKMREAFALQKASYIFSTKMFSNFNETLTYDAVSFEQLDLIVQEI